jgi:hypothetical protein
LMNAELIPGPSPLNQGGPNLQKNRGWRAAPDHLIRMD